MNRVIAHVPERCDCCHAPLTEKAGLSCPVPKAARSLSRCAQHERILAAAVLGLAGPGKKISSIMPCTVIRPGDMADSILDRDKHPEWNGERTKMVYSFPTNEKLWARYAEIRAESLRIHGDLREPRRSTWPAVRRPTRALLSPDRSVTTTMMRPPSSTP